MLNYNVKKLFFVLNAIIIFSFLCSCGIYQPSDARTVSPNSKERVKKNLEEGKGISIGKLMKGGSGGTANVTVNIAADGQASSNLTANNGQQAADLAKAVSAAVQEEMHKQQRPGGILSPYGGG